LGGLELNCAQRISIEMNRNRLLLAVGLLSLVMLASSTGWAQAQQQAKDAGSEPIPEPAVPAILAAFDKYEVVAIPEAHGKKDLDDFILSLIRNPIFPEKVNDIEVECGNSLYQSILDRYIAGDGIPFTEVRKVWRNTTAAMCDVNGFFEQFFPLVRAINQKLQPKNRIRVLAGDPPIDWDKVRTSQDFAPFQRNIKNDMERDATIASVMEKEVLSKHRKALMLFGVDHLFHGVGTFSAVSIYEKDYPNVTFAISELGIFDTSLPTFSSSPFKTWPVSSLTRTKGTWLGALELTQFIPATPYAIDKDCNVFKPLEHVENLVDAFLYFGPQDLRLAEQVPADIALDSDYTAERQRRAALRGLPQQAASPTFTSALILSGAVIPDQQIVNSAENPMFVPLKPRALYSIAQACIELKTHSNTPQNRP
jgi:hypothetical protein